MWFMPEMAESLSSDVFQWGKKQAGTSSSYESMCLKGVWYNLYDNVFCRSGRTKPYVGKLMRLFEEDGVKKVRIRWFFRPEELPLFVRKDFSSNMLQSKELFIGLGSGVGVENENLVNVICGKAMVLCIAKVKDNPLPSSAQLESAHHFFSKAYDIGKKKLVKLGNILNKLLVEKMCNKEEWMLEKVHEDDCIEESCEANVGFEEEKISSAMCSPTTKEKKEDLLHPMHTLKARLDSSSLSATSVEKEEVDSTVKITTSSGRKRIFLKTSAIVPIFLLKKRKV